MLLSFADEVCHGRGICQNFTEQYGFSSHPPKSLRRHAAEDGRNNQAHFTLFFRRKYMHHAADGFQSAPVVERSQNEMPCFCRGKRRRYGFLSRISLQQ